MKEDPAKLIFSHLRKLEFSVFIYLLVVLRVSKVS